MTDERFDRIEKQLAEICRKLDQSRERGERLREALDQLGSRLHWVEIYGIRRGTEAIRGFTELRRELRLLRQDVADRKTKHREADRDYDAAIATLRGERQ
jgi:hypothetical protein